jgi:hypothetical protein
LSVLDRRTCTQLGLTRELRSSAWATGKFLCWWLARAAPSQRVPPMNNRVFFLANGAISYIVHRCTNLIVLLCLAHERQDKNDDWWRFTMLQKINIFVQSIWGWTWWPWCTTLCTWYLVDNHDAL